MTDNEREDKDPEPIKHVVAERVGPGGDAGGGSGSGDASPSPSEEIEDDPAYNPDDETLREVKGG